MANLVILPKLTYEMLDGRISEWLCKEGQLVTVGEPLFVVETDKAAVEVTADEAGMLLQILVPAGQSVPVSTPVAWIGAPGEATSGPDRPPETAMAGAANPDPVPEQVALTAGATAITAGPDEAEEVLATPIARRLARELGVDLRAVRTWSGQRRVREADVQGYSEAHKAPAVAPARPAVAPVAPAAPSLGDSAWPPIPAPFDLLTPSPLQRTMAAHLARAASIPHMAAACEVNLQRLEQFRADLRPAWEQKYGFKLTYTHIMAALVARALLSCPMLNASWTDEGIRLYRSVHLGVAMASPRGLLVPVVRDAAQRSLSEIAAEIVRLQQAAEQGRIAPQDLEGGTFTMTNVGMLGVTLSVPLLNPPQSGIMGIGARREQLVLENGQVRAAPVLTITVVADHRVADGAAVAACLQRCKELFESPWPALGQIG